MVNPLGLVTAFSSHRAGLDFAKVNLLDTLDVRMRDGLEAVPLRRFVLLNVLM
jgi:hypothetical protein